jgi:hypothetical protein
MYGDSYGWLSSWCPTESPQEKHEYKGLWIITTEYGSCFAVYVTIRAFEKKTKMIYKIPSMIKMPIASFYFKTSGVSASRLKTIKRPTKANSNFKLVLFLGFKTNAMI